jgi:aminoglycoside phosphotransferase (APT) family kinase protein
VSATDDFDGGWDNRVTLVDGWVHRTPRFPDREAQLRREAALLPWLAPRLPLPTPRLEVVADDPFTVRHAYLPGGPCPGTSAAQGASVGAFLRALHDVDPEEAVRHGALDAGTALDSHLETVERMSRAVLPRLPSHVRPDGTALLERVSTMPSDARLAHGDLGPEHIRVVGEEVTGVIDWGDCCVRDPAIDLAWTAFGAGRPFADAALATYGADDALVARGLDLHLLGPWHEVLYGLGEGGPDFVSSGLAGVISRLETYGRHAFRGQ